ncbi:hypothetical protein JW698_00945 [Candidatus Wolfebacteria bacterium]|nr:hypothetical protein [Candidatus Wolfebacteria bacterium]
MLKISRQQVLNRWDTLSNKFKEALFSEYNYDFLLQICEKQHLTEDKIRKIAILVGDVIFGFLHPEDLAKEIKNELNINQEIASSIAEEIDKKIFLSIRDELEKVYQPPVKETVLDLRNKVAGQSELNKNSIGDLKIIEETEKKVESSENKPIEKPIISKEKLQPESKISEKQPQKPISISQKTSLITDKISPLDSESAITPSEIFGGAKPVSIGEIKSVKPEASEDAPLIIQKETKFKPISESKKSLGGLFNFLIKGKEKEEKQAPVKAKIEIGGFKKEEQKIGTTPKLLEKSIEEKKEPLKVNFSFGFEKEKIKQVPQKNSFIKFISNKIKKPKEEQLFNKSKSISLPLNQSIDKKEQTSQGFKPLINTEIKSLNQTKKDEFKPFVSIPKKETSSASKQQVNYSEEQILNKTEKLKENSLINSTGKSFVKIKKDENKPKIMDFSTEIGKDKDKSLTKNPLINFKKDNNDKISMVDKIESDKIKFVNYADMGEKNKSLEKSQQQKEIKLPIEKPLNELVKKPSINLIPKKQGIISKFFSKFKKEKSLQNKAQIKPEASVAIETKSSANPLTEFKKQKNKPFTINESELFETNRPGISNLYNSYKEKDEKNEIKPNEFQKKTETVLPEKKEEKKEKDNEELIDLKKFG